MHTEKDTFKRGVSTMQIDSLLQLETNENGHGNTTTTTSVLDDV